MTDSETELVRRARDAFRQSARHTLEHSRIEPDVSRFLGREEVSDGQPVVVPGADEEEIRIVETGDPPTVVAHEDAATARMHPSDVLLESLAHAEDVVGVFAWPDGRVHWANESLTDLASADELSWTLVSVLDEWSQAHFVARVLPALLSDRHWRGFLRFIEPEGTTMWMAATVIAHSSGVDPQIDALVVLAHEVVPTPLSFVQR